MPAKPSKPQNMVDSCKQLEREQQLPRSLRIQVPRMLVALYEIRNNRGVGHAGGDVDPSHMDAVAVLYMSKWLMAELIRVFHNVTTSEATDAVDLLVERELPTVWSVDGKKRVLAGKLNQWDKTLLLLYSEPGAVAETDLPTWIEAANASRYRRDVLHKAHRERLLEYDQINRTVRLSPKGVRHVEEHLPLVA
jgi:hypothetical protein